jgi:hypothetical protein
LQREFPVTSWQRKVIHLEEEINAQSAVSLLFKKLIPVDEEYPMASLDIHLRWLAKSISSNVTIGHTLC